MICYNITVKIDPAIEQEWIRWQKEEHIPGVMATGLFTEFKFFKLLEQDESEGITYIVQYFSRTMEDYDLYIKKFAPALREQTFLKWKDHFVAFRTVMKLVN